MDYFQHRLPGILLIDNDQTSHLRAVKHLSADKFKLISCYIGKKGIEALKKHRPDIVLNDIGTPINNGIETCAEIRILTISENIALVMITVKEDYQKIVHASAAGVDDFIAKPINERELPRHADYMAKANNILLKLKQSRIGSTKTGKMARHCDWEWQPDSRALCRPDNKFNLVKRIKEQFVPSIKDDSYSKSIPQAGCKSCWEYCTTVFSSPRPCSI